MKTATLAALALVALAAPSAAQGTPADDMQTLRIALGSEKKPLVTENLELTPDEAQAFWPVYDAYQVELGALDDRTTKLISTYSQNFLALSDELAEKLLDQMLAIQRDRETVRTEFLPRFREVLPPKKLARYYQLENKVRAVVDFELARNIPLVR